MSNAPLPTASWLPETLVEAHAACDVLGRHYTTLRGAWKKGQIPGAVVRDGLVYAPWASWQKWSLHARRVNRLKAHSPATIAPPPPVPTVQAALPLPPPIEPPGPAAEACHSVRELAAATIQLAEVLESLRDVLAGGKPPAPVHSPGVKGKG